MYLFKHSITQNLSRQALQWKTDILAYRKRGESLMQSSKSTVILDVLFPEIKTEVSSPSVNKSVNVRYPAYYSLFPPQAESESTQL